MHNDFNCSFFVAIDEGVRYANTRDPQVEIHNVQAIKGQV